MIYGQFSTFFNPFDSPELLRLNETIIWESANHFPEKLENLTVGVFSDIRFPYKKSDFLFFDKNHEVLVVFWGHVYNKGLLSSGFPSETQSPIPKLILRLFVEEGPQFVKKLNGDFAIAIYQKKQNSLMLFRDHLGIIPLAYTVFNRSILFSTDVMSLCNAFASKENFELEALLGDFKVIDNHSTCNQDVVKVLPGHFIEYNEMGLSTKKYWAPEEIKTDKTLTYDRAVADLKGLLFDSIAIRSDPRFSAGTHLSGGLDSSLIGVLARKNYPNQKPFYGFSWSPINTKGPAVAFDERNMVQEICNQNNITSVFFEITIANFISTINSSEKKFPSIWEEKVVQMARERNLNLLFSGWGGQEFISFENQGIDIELFLGGHWFSYLKRNPVSKPIRFLKSFISKIILPSLGILSPGISRTYLNYTKYLTPRYKKCFSPAIKRYHFAKTRREVHLAILANGDIPVRTEGWAVSGAKVGIEYRYPLLDKRIVEYMLRIPTKILIKENQSRVIFRELCIGFLPEKVRLRNSTIDPVLYNSFFQLLKSYSVNYYDDLKEMKNNPKMNFVDFYLLQKDISILTGETDSRLTNRIHETMLALKLIHNYTKTY